ncbi:MAG: hypothetical protein ACIAXF_07795 [Phycisphaerales bacterium JB063]
MRVFPTTRAARCRLAVLLLIVVSPVLAYVVWSPGSAVTDGRHDQGTNGIWMSHRWLGDDAWFQDNGREALRPQYRDPAYIEETLGMLAQRGVVDLMPHLCPCDVHGALPAVDAAQVERVLDTAQRHGQRVLPWVGGVFGDGCLPERVEWRRAFVASVVALLEAHPRLAGIHLNVEPWPDGNADMLLLLDELRAAMPNDKTISVAAYPPPTRWQPDEQVHWGETYFRDVARRCDHLAVMMYDSAVPLRKPYTHLMARWTREVLMWSEGREVLLGLPAYDDAGVGYHDPAVENLSTGLAGVHAGIAQLDHPNTKTLAPGYRGIALYSLWEIDAEEWALFDERFARP